MKKLGEFIHRNRWVVIGASAVFIIACVVYGTTLFEKLSSGGFQDESADSYQVLKDIQTRLPQTDPEVIVLFKDKQNRLVTDPAVKQEIERTLKRASRDPSIESITTYYQTGSPALVSRDQAKTYAAINMKGDRDDQTKTFPGLRQKLTNPSLDIKVGGQAAVYVAFNQIIEDDLKLAETISFSALAVLLVIVFRGVVAATLPLLVGVFAILGAFLITRLLTSVTDISQFAINAIIFLGLGLAIDYSLFIVSRFREELRSSGTVDTAIAITMKTAGRTVLFSGITVMISLLALLVFPLGFLKSMGIGGAAAVVVAMIGALVFLPAILSILGKRVYSLSFGVMRREKRALSAGKLRLKEHHSIWYRLSRKVMQHPLLVIVLALTPLILAGLPFLQANLQNPDYRSLPPKNEVRQVSEALRNDFSDKGNPIQILVSSKASLTEPQNLADLQTYAQKIASLPRVASIESLPSSVPGFSAETYPQLLATSDPTASAVRSQFIDRSSKLTYVNVYFKGEMLAVKNQELVNRIRDVPINGGLEAKVGGNTAELVDLLAALKKYTPVALGLIITGLFILLFLMLGSVVIPLKAIILNILSLSASFGAITWIFQDGHFEKLLGFESVGAIDANQPILIFAIAFGLSMDYAVFLLSRIKEQYDQTKNTEEAVAEGVQKTGSIITSAALLLIVVVGAFGTSQIPLMKQLAVGLVLAIAIDALIIRMLLVPASMKLLGRYNWWAPRPLKRLHAKLGLSD